MKTNIKQQIATVLIFASSTSMGGEVAVEVFPASIALAYNTAGNLGGKDEKSGLSLTARVGASQEHNVRATWQRFHENGNYCLLAKDSNIKNLGEGVMVRAPSKSEGENGCFFCEYTFHFEKLPSDGAQWVQLTGDIPIEIWSTRQVAESRDIVWEEGGFFSCGEVMFKIKEYRRDKNGEEVQIELEYDKYSKEKSISPREVLNIEFLDEFGSLLKADWAGAGGGGDSREYEYNEEKKVHGNPKRVRIEYIKKLEKKSHPVNIRFPLHELAGEGEATPKKENNLQAGEE